MPTEFGGAITTIPTPMLNVRNISGSLDAARLRQLLENVRYSPAADIDQRVERRRQRAIEIAGKAAAGDVRHRVDGAVGQHRSQRREVRAMDRQQHVRRRAIVARKAIRNAEVHPLGDDAPGERKTIRVESAALETDQHVAVPHATGTKDRVFVHVADDETGQVVVRRRVDARHLGRLAADQRAAVLATARGDAGDDAFDDLRLERAHRDVVEKEQRQRALHENVVDAVVHEVVADRVVAAGVDRDLELRPDAVGAGDEHRLGHVGRDAEHAAESAELAARARGERRQHVRLDALLRVVGRVDVDAGGAVVERLRRRHASVLERDEPMEVADALREVIRRDLEQPVDGEFLDGERAHRGAVHDGAPQIRLGEVAVLREIAHESAGERIAGAGRIEHRLERIRRREEHVRLREHERAVLALLDHDVLRAAFHDPARRLDEVELLGELARLGVVQRDQIDVREQLEQVGTPALDPEVHRVAGDELRLGDLRQHVELQPRIDVPEKHERRVPKLLGNLRPKVREHAEVRLERLGDVEVVAVPAAPAKRRPLRLLEPGRCRSAATRTRASACRADSRRR